MYWLKRGNVNRLRDEIDKDDDDTSHNDATCQRKGYIIHFVPY